MTMSDTTTIVGHMTYTMAIFGSLYVCVYVFVYVLVNKLLFYRFFCIFVFILDDRVIVLNFFSFFFVEFWLQKSNQSNKKSNELLLLMEKMKEKKN